MMIKLLQIRKAMTNPQNFEFLEKIAAQGRAFFVKMKEKQIEMRLISKFFINHENDQGRNKIDQLKTILQLCCADIYDAELPLKIKIEYEDIYSDLKIFKNFCEWIKKLGMPLSDLQARNQQFEEFEKGILGLQLNQVLQIERWSFRNKTAGQSEILQSQECYHHFKHSKIMMNIFQQHKDKVFSQVRTVLDFDRASFETLFVQIANQTFKELLIESQTSMKFEKLATCMKGVNVKDLGSELMMITNFFKEIMNEDIGELIEQDQVNFLKSFCQIQEYLILTKDFLDLEYLYQIGQDLGEENKQDDPHLKQFINFKAFTDRLKEMNPSMSEIHKEIKEIQDLINEVIKKQYQLNMEDIRIYGASKELIQFCIQKRGTDFNDLNQIDDSQQFIDYKLINQMNIMSIFFTNLHDKIKENKALNPNYGFIEMCKLIKDKFDEQTDIDMSFQTKLKDCNNSIERFRNWYVTQMNTDDNTMQVVNEGATKGVIIWERVDEDRYKLKLEIPSQPQVPLTNEKINQHCGRALLMINPCSDENVKELEKEMNIIIFVEIIRISQEIKDILTDFVLYGHYDYAKVNSQFKIISVAVESEDSIISKLKNMKDLFSNMLIKWREFLVGARKRFYCLNFIPNQMIPLFIDFMEAPSVANFKPIKYTLKSINKHIIYRKINEEFTGFDSKIQEESQCSLPIEQKIDLYFKKLQEILNNITMLNPVNEKFAPQTDEGFDDDLYKSGFYKVDNEYDMIKEILSLFYINNQVPQSYQVMFCEKTTKIQDIEIFILRALRNQERKMFVLGNFQNLPLYIQLESQKLINQYAKEFSDLSKQLLYTLFYKQENRDSYLIEALLKAPKLSVGMTLSDFKNKVVRSFMNQNKSIHVVTADRTGLGKSQQISQWAKEDETMKYIRIPIYGETNRAKLADRHNLEFSNEVISQYSRYAIHYDIYHAISGSKASSKKESLNTILFDILILNSLNRGAGCLFQFENDTHFYLEIADSITRIFEQSSLFIDFFPRVHFQWKQQSSEDEREEEKKQIGVINFSKVLVNETTIKVSDRVDSDIQMVCRYLDANKPETRYSQATIAALQNPRNPLPTNICQQLLHINFLQELAKPNYYLLNSFVSLMAEQIRRLHQCPSFNESVFFSQYTRASEAELVYKDCVQSFYTLTQKLTQNQTVSAGVRIIRSQEDIEKDKIERLQHLKWSSNINFILFNDQGSITPVFSDATQLPNGIVRHFTTFRVPLRSYNEMEQFDFHNKILEMCVETKRVNEVKKAVNLGLLQFTKDNFVKLALIYFRLCSKQPVIIMGETGVGKTSLIRYLSEIMNAHFSQLYIHAGIEEKEIIEFIQNSIQLAIAEPSKKTIIFLDEINTSEHINGMLKEIIIDRHLLGQLLPSNISLVAACNPYKYKTQEQLQQAKAGFSNNKSRESDLVYQVYELPEAMFSYIWDYGSLAQNEELEYISKILSNLNPSMTSLNELSKIEIANIAHIVSTCQTFTKKNEAEWAVSLRDISRFTDLFIFFAATNYRKTEGFRVNPNPKDTDKTRAIILSVAFCYFFRIAVLKKREEFLKQLEPTLAPFQIDIQYFRVVLEQEQMRFIKEMEIPKGIGLNSLLKENVFAMIICILNNIPLFIVGKPGSSKSLAMNLVTKSFKGKCSKSKLFKQYPSIFSMMYQGSEQSTSQGIKKIFENAFAKQKLFKENRGEQEMLALIIIEEIGLAEISPHKPLKVLHELLEPPKVPTIGISNWALDASKMNRAISLQRPDPNEDDLRESAKKIAEVINQDQPEKLEIFVNEYLDWLIKGYIKIFERLRPAFFGLRDFYCMIKQINIGLVAQNENSMEKNNQLVLRAIQRNFGGHTDQKQVMSFFQQAARDNNMHTIFDNAQLDLTLSQQLIKDNLIDSKSRNLLISTDCVGKTISFIQRMCLDNNKDCQVKYGSDFPEDTAEEAAYKMIKEIVLCMERGFLCILLNLESIYQSFYDMLNQNYQEIEGKLYCKIAIGSDSKLKLVHPDFKCVLLIERDMVMDLDLPLLNRFEKQVFTDDLVLSHQVKEINKEVNNWINEISFVGNFKDTDTFPLIDSDIIQSIIFKNYSDSLEQSEIISICKSDIMNMACYAGVFRMRESKAQDREYWIQSYLDNKSHLSLDHLLNQEVTNKKEGQNIIVNYFSAMTTDIVEKINSSQFKIEEVIQLNEVLSKDKFEKKLHTFLNKSKTNLLLIFVEPHVDSQRRIDLIISLINSQRQKQKDFSINKHICVLIRYEPKPHKYKLYLNEKWSIFCLDFLSDENEQGLTIDEARNRSFMDMIRNEKFFLSIVHDRLTKSFSMIQYNRNDPSWLSKRLLKVRAVFAMCGVIDEVRRFIVELIIRNQQFNEINWIQQVVMDSSLMVNYTIIGAASEYFKDIIEKYLATVIYSFESEGLIQGLYNQRSKAACVALLKPVIDSLFLVNNKPKQQYILSKVQTKCRYPFSKLIHQEFLKLKANYMHELDLLNTKYNGGDDEEEEQEETKGEDFQVISPDEQKDKDMMLQVSIENDVFNCIKKLEDQVSAILPEHFKSVKDVDIMNILNPQEFLLDFCVITQGNNIDKKMHTFLYQVILILLKYRVESIAFIYGVFWRMEKVIQASMSFVIEGASVFNMKNEVCNNFKLCYDNIKEEDTYESRKELYFVQRDLFVDCLVRLYHFLYFPSEKRFDEKFSVKNLSWEECAKNSYDILNTLAGQFMKKESLELLQMELLTDFYSKIVVPLEISIDQIIIFAKHVRNFDLAKIQNFIENIVLDRKKLPHTIEPLEQFEHQIIKYFFENRSDPQNLLNKKDLVNFLFLQILKHKLHKAAHLDVITADQFLRKCRMIAYIVTLIVEDSPDGENIFMEVDKDIPTLTQMGSSLMNELIKRESMNIFKFREKMNEESPFILALTDQIEKQLPDEIDDDHMRKCIQQAMEDCISKKISIVKKAMSIAYFRKVIKIFVAEINYAISDDSFEFRFPNAQEILKNLLYRQTNIEWEPLRLYSIKIINEELDMFKFDKAKDYAPWISKYRNQYLSNQVFYPIMLDSKIQSRNDFMNFQSQQEIFNRFKIFFANESMNEEDKFFLSSMTLQYFYLNNNQQYFKEHIEKELRCAKHLGNTMIDYLTTLCSDEEMGIQQKAFVLKEDEQEKEIQIFLSYLGALGLSANKNSLFAKIMDNPECIKDIYLPFLPNVKEDFYYHDHLTDGKTFKRWRCKTCKNIFVISDCGDISNHRSRDKSINIGGMKCQYCGKDIGFGGEANSEMVENVKHTKKTFSTDKECQKSYVRIFAGEINDLTLRKLKKKSLLIGHLVIHCLMLVSFLFAEKQKQIGFMNQYCKSQQQSDLSFKDERNLIIKELMEHIKSDWEEIKITLNYGNQMMQILLEDIVCQIFKRSKILDFTYETLNTREGRLLFESAFEKILPKDDEALHKQLSRNLCCEADDTSLQLSESMKMSYLSSFLRKQRPITLNNFLTFVQQQEDPDSNNLKNMIKFKEQLKRIKCLKDLLNWSNIVLQTWGNKITFEDSIEFSIRDMIKNISIQNQKQAAILLNELVNSLIASQCEQQSSLMVEGPVDNARLIEQVRRVINDKFEINNEEMVSQIEKLLKDQGVDDESINKLKQALNEIVSKQTQKGQSNYILNKYKKFEKAWNTFIGRGFSEGCDEIVIQRISLDSKFQFCCITSVNKESLGYHFYLLLKYIASLQNEFLQRVSERIAQRVQNQTELMKLSGKQIIQNEISEEDAESIILNYNSFNSLIYGNGVHIFYDLSHILKQFESLLLAGKAIIKWEEEVNFAYTNVGNPYAQFDNILDKIKPQQRNPLAYIIVESLTEQKRHQLFNDELRTVINLLQQTGGPENQSLIDYMSAFNLEQFKKEILPEIKLKNFLHFYEVLEGACASILTQRTDRKYYRQLGAMTKDQLNEIVFDNFLRSPLTEFEDELLHIKRALERMCIRQLSYNQQQSSEDKLFTYLFEDFNKYLFDVDSNPDLQRWYKLFQPLQEITIGHAYHIYSQFNEYEEQIQLKRIQAQLEIGRRKSTFIQQSSDSNNDSSGDGGDDSNFDLFGNSKISLQSKMNNAKKEDKTSIIKGAQKKAPTTGPGVKKPPKKGPI